MDTDVIRTKQDSIARCIGRIQSKADLSFEALLEDYDAQDVITLNLERAIVYSITHEHLSDFKTFVREIDCYIERQTKLQEAEDKAKTALPVESKPLI